MPPVNRQSSLAAPLDPVCAVVLLGLLVDYDPDGDTQTSLATSPRRVWNL